MRGVVVWCALLVACQHSWGPDGPVGRQAGAGRAYRVTVVDATIKGHRPDGGAWNTSKPSRTWTVIGLAAGLAVGQAALGKEVGSWFDGDERSFPPAPLVELNVGGAKYSTAALEPTLSPNWDQVLLLDLTGSRDADLVVVNVRDGVDGDVVGTIQMTVGDLVARRTHTISSVPSVPSLNLRVEPARLDRVAYALHVPANGEATIEVTGGDIVTLAAQGEVCVVPGKCFGPDGDPEIRATGILSRPYEYKNRRSNPPVFQDTPHASLVGWLDDLPIAIGAGTTYRIRRSGALRMFVNDIAPTNNTGYFDVVITINPCGADCTMAPASDEPLIQLEKIAINAQFASEEFGGYPAGSMGLTPSTPCCAQPGHRCPPSPGAWTAPLWRRLDLQITAPSAFQYAYESDGAGFTVTAVGDPACNGRTATYSIHHDAQRTDVRLSFETAPLR